MPQEINISIEDIQYAEKILLPEGANFDSERLDFIYNFDTIDLQAVPGSGKTTALLAKLLILETKLPLVNNRGILILSHTNKAVNEIKERIGKHCPKLFSYPNFIGTIQSFVDQFLAIPYINNYLGFDIKRVDSDLFKEQLWREFQIISWNQEYDRPTTLFWGKHIAEAKKESIRTGVSESVICNLKIEKNIKDLYFDFNDEKIKVFRDDSVVLATKTNKKYIGIKECVLNVLNNGFISYEYAYKMGLNCISVYPKMKLILQERFKFVFVDEMQDMDTHQYNLLETIFYDDGSSKSVYQRIGDINQAIYSGEVHTDEVWEFRGTPLTINGSHRLSANIAELVNCFTLNSEGGFQVEGKNENSNLKPHLIVYKTDKIKEVIPKFSQIIKGYIDSEDIIISNKSKFKVIGWVKEKEGDKLGITDYSEQFKPQSTSQKIDYDNLYSYLTNFDKGKRTLEPIRKSILNALIKILRIESIKNFENRYFSKKQLLNHLSESYEDEYIYLKRNLFEWCIDIIRGKTDEVYISLKAYIPNLLNLFEKEINHSKDFIDNVILQPVGEDSIEPLAKDNIVNYNDINIEVSTVHSVKGQTHTATLYLETSYQNGNDTYETQRLSSQLKHNDFFDTRKYHKQSTKMAYVGFSRPTDLLCVAVCKDRFDSHLSDIDTNKWKVINV